MKVKKAGEIFFWSCKLSIARSMEYRLDFFLGLFVNLLLSLAGPLFQYLLFAQVDGYPGWGISEIILFQGVLLLVLGLKTLLFGGVFVYVQKLIHRGGLDRLLLRPCSSIGMILANGFSLDGIGTVLAGIIIMAVMLYRLQLKVSVFVCLAVLLSIVAGLALFVSFQIFLACAMVRLVHIGRLNEIFDTIARFGQYPMELYPKGARLFFATILPFAIWVNIPCKILLDGIQGYMFFTVVFVALLYGAAVYSWNLCIRHYTSAGG